VCTYVRAYEEEFYQGGSWHIVAPSMSNSSAITVMSLLASFLNMFKAKLTAPEYLSSVQWNNHIPP
jgi:hypothetical protein